MIVVKKAAKEAGKKLGVRFPDSSIEALDKVIMAKLERAADRAKKNGRVTLKGFDF
jgi:histone H3/H4